MTALKLPQSTCGVRYRDHGDRDDTVIPCDDTTGQAEWIGRLLAEQGIVAEPVTIKYEADKDLYNEIRFKLVEAAIKDLAEGESDYLEVAERTRLLSPRLIDNETFAPSERCFRGHWVDAAVKAARQLEALKDAPPSDEETDIEADYDEAIDTLAGIRGHGPNRQPCPDCRTRKAAVTANATAQQGSAA